MIDLMFNVIQNYIFNIWSYIKTIKNYFNISSMCIENKTTLIRKNSFTKTSDNNVIQRLNPYHTINSDIMTHQKRLEILKITSQFEEPKLYPYKKKYLPFIVRDILYGTHLKILFRLLSFSVIKKTKLHPVLTPLQKETSIAKNKEVTTRVADLTSYINKKKTMNLVDRYITILLKDKQNLKDIKKNIVNYIFSNELLGQNKLSDFLITILKVKPFLIEERCYLTKYNLDYSKTEASLISESENLNSHISDDPITVSKLDRASELLLENRFYNPIDKEFIIINFCLYLWSNIANYHKYKLILKFGLGYNKFLDTSTLGLDEIKNIVCTTVPTLMQDLKRCSQTSESDEIWNKFILIGLLMKNIRENSFFFFNPS